MPTHLHLDPFSGIAGDMFLGALLDLGASLESLTESLAKLPGVTPYTLKATRTMRQGVSATNFHVHLSEASHHHEHAHKHDHSHGHHSHVTCRDILHMLDHAKLPDRTHDRATRVIRTLAEAEARVHNMEVEKVHFHEVGAVDSIVDMIGAAIALEQLDIATLSCGPLPISRGMVKCAHGMMPIPAPATAYLLEDLPVMGVDREGELVTPTGAAIVRALCDRVGVIPAMTLQQVGYGAGDRDTPPIPNVLRVYRGELLKAGDLGPVKPTLH